MTALAGSGRLADLRPVGDPVVFVYGTAVDDVFIGRDFIERRDDEEPWAHLHAESHGMDRRREPFRPAQPSKMTRFRGPLGDTMLAASRLPYAQEGRSRRGGRCAQRPDCHQRGLR